ncbi:MAG: hypothetical protein V4625_19425 [Pseudomonadota bacterium]
MKTFTTLGKGIFNVHGKFLPCTLKNQDSGGLGLFLGTKTGKKGAQKAIFRHQIGVQTNIHGREQLFNL